MCTFDDDDDDGGGGGGGDDDVDFFFRQRSAKVRERLFVSQRKEKKDLLLRLVRQS